MTSWKKDPDPQPGVRLTRRGEIAAVTVAILALLFVLGLAGLIEGATS